MAAIDAAYGEAIGNTGRPTVILAKTEKGHGVAEVANKNGFHGKPLPHPEEAIAELGGIRRIHVDVPKPSRSGEPHRFPTGELQLPAYETGGKEATRKAYGDTLVALGYERTLVRLDAAIDLLAREAA